MKVLVPVKRVVDFNVKVRVKSDGTALERLTVDPAYDDQAAFSPDGRKLVFVTTRAGRTAEGEVVGARVCEPVG